MSFGGHAAAMISSLKNNRSLLSRKSLKERSRDAFSHLGEKKQQHKRLHHKKASKEETEYIKREIRKENRKQRQRNLISALLIIILSLAFFYGVFVLWGFLGELVN